MLQVKDSKTDATARELVDGRGISITEAIQQAVKEALAQDHKARSSLWDRTAYLRERVVSWESTGTPPGE